MVFHISVVQITATYYAIACLGEVLSKQHLQLNNTIKKLRSKLSDRDSSVKDLTEKIDKVKDENKSLKSVKTLFY